MPACALITGISGQDGFLLARHLVDRSVRVVGITSDLVRAKREFSADRAPQVELVQFDYSTNGIFAELVAHYRPTQIFNFAARATGQGMFDAPYNMSRINGGFVLDILEAIRESDRREEISFCQASSSEMFGRVLETPQNEGTPFHPKSPYGAAKLYAHNLIGIYRSAYKIRCCAAILYNHESLRRSVQFVTRKIARGAALIKRGLSKELSLGNLEFSRDWGYAPEYVEAMSLMASAEHPADYIVATGRLTTVRRLCEIAFGHLGLQYDEFVKLDPSVLRPVDSVLLHGDPSKIKAELGWTAKTTVEQVIVEMVDHEMSAPTTKRRDE